MSYMMYAPTRVLFGAGQLSHLHEQKLPGITALLVISSGKSVRENGALDRTMEELAHAGVQTVLFDKIVDNARATMGGLFFADPCELTHEDCVKILRNSYR